VKLIKGLVSGKLILSLDKNRGMIHDNYFLIQGSKEHICYILIIPGFGIISHVVSTFSGKPIFGQTIFMNGPCNNIFSLYYYFATYYVQEGRCILFGTKGKRIIRYFFNVVALVIIYAVLSNPQVTNAQLIFEKINFEDPSMLVGTSETVRMFSTCICSKALPILL
jgi:hypothetical protein